MSVQNIHWLLRKENISKLWVGFIVILILTVLAGLFVHQHESFGIEDSVGFFAWYGFVTCVGMVVFAKLLGVILKRPENYYDDDADQGLNKNGVQHD